MCKCGESSTGVHADAVRTNVAACVGCRFNTNPDGGVCTADHRRRSAWHMAHRSICPAGYHAQVLTINGEPRVVTRRWGIRWFGLPMPERVRLWLRHGVRPGQLPGCGCVVVLKLATEWAAERVTAWAAMAMRPTRKAKDTETQRPEQQGAAA